MKTLHDFRESDRAEDPVQWLSSFYTVISSVPTLKEEDKIRVLASKLHAGARGMLDAMSPPPETIEQAVNRLIPRLSPASTSQIQSQLDLKAVRQGDTEGVFPFYQRLSEIAYRTMGKVDDDRVLEMIKDKLNARTMTKLMVYSHTIHSLEDAITVFKLIDGEAAATGSAPSVAVNYLQAPKKPSCKYCRRIGHTVDDCWRKGSGSRGGPRQGPWRL